VGQVLGGDARARVAHRGYHLPAVSPGRNLVLSGVEVGDFSAWWRVGGRIGQQIAQDLPHPHRQTSGNHIRYFDSAQYK
jgi:hypothetical protein